MLGRIIDLLADHAAAVVAGGAGGLASLGFAAGAIPMPEGVPWWVPYCGSLLAPILAVIGTRLLAGHAARLRSLASSKRRRAQALLADGDRANDAEGHKLEDEADSLDAQADAADAVSRAKK